MDLLEILFLLTGVFFSFGAISYFFLGNNIWFSTAEHIGLGANVAIILAGDFRSLFPNCIDQVVTGRLSLLIPLIIGLLAFTRWTRFRWSARYPTAVLSGIGVGLMVGLQVRSSIVSMIVETVNDAFLGRPDPISGIIVFIAMVAVLTYYLYGTRVSTPLREGALGAIPKLGTYFLLLAAGYLYSNIYMFEGIDLASGFFIMRFKRVWEEITL